MSFRQRNREPDVVWRKRSRSSLLAAGLPDFVVDDERRWNYVLLHGADELESGWSPLWVTRQQAADMLSLLEGHYENETGLELFGALRKRVEGSYD